MNLLGEDLTFSCEVATAVGVVVALIGAAFTLYQWCKKQKEVRAAFLEKLLSDFENNQLYCHLRSSDDDMILGIDLNCDNGVNLTYQFIQKCNHLLYLKKQKLINKDEFAHFVSILERFVQNDVIRREIKRGKIKLDSYDDFFSYVKMIDAELFIDVQAQVIERDVEINSLPEEGVEEISEADFNEPTMVIKINRLYREEMTDEELYEVTRQWWKIKKERAEKMKYALAVSDSIVRKAFSIDHWETDKDVGEDYDGRIRFVGKVSDKMQQRFVGKSVKFLFPKGASNPIRYFDKH